MDVHSLVGNYLYGMLHDGAWRGVVIIHISNNSKTLELRIRQDVWINHSDVDLVLSGLITDFLLINYQFECDSNSLCGDSKYQWCIVI